MQVNPALRSGEFMGIVHGYEPCPPKFIIDSEGKKIPIPEFNMWTCKDQYILSWLTMTLSDWVLSVVYGLNTSRQVWSVLSSRFASQSQSRVTNLKKQL
jgi:hypothetical protein